MKRDGGTGKMIEVHCSPLGSPGTPLVGPNRGLAWNQTLTYIYLRLPGLKLGNDSHNTQLLQ